MGDREMLDAINTLKEKLRSVNSVAEAMPTEVDASYQNTDFGAVPTQLLIDRYENRFRKEQCYKIDITIKLPQFKIKQILIIGDEVEIATWLDGLSSVALVQAFLLDLYHGLSDL